MRVFVSSSFAHSFVRFLLLNSSYTYKYCCWQGYPPNYRFLIEKPHVLKKVIIIANESRYPPECVVVLLMFFLCAVVILKLIIVPYCSRAMNSNGFALLALRMKPRLQAAILNRHGFRTRLQNVAMGV